MDRCPKLRVGPRLDPPRRSGGGTPSNPQPPSFPREMNPGSKVRVGGFRKTRKKLAVQTSMQYGSALFRRTRGRGSLRESSHGRLQEINRPIWNS